MQASFEITHSIDLDIKLKKQANVLGTLCREWQRSTKFRHPQMLSKHVP